MFELKYLYICQNNLFMSIKKETKTERFYLAALVTPKRKTKFQDPKFRARLNREAQKMGFKKWSDSKFVTAVMEMLHKNPSEAMKTVKYDEID
jgi:hypothetical protein